MYTHVYVCVCIYIYIYIIQSFASTKQHINII